MSTQKLDEVLAPFKLQKDVLKSIADNMVEDFKTGLEIGCPQSSTAMLPTFLPKLPCHEQSGRYLAMDVSGTNCRILLLSMTAGSARPEILKRNFILTTEIMTGTGEELFDFLAKCLERFLSEHNLKDADLPLGFVFSYPCNTTSLRSSTLLWWTKGFSVTGVVGLDVVKLLEAAIQRRGEAKEKKYNTAITKKDIKVRVKSIMNDTVAQLAAAGYEHGPSCMMSVVVGNGCNAAYIEDTENIKKFDAGAAGYRYDQMVIDTEWEEFGNKGQLASISTNFDKEIDENSVHVGRQIIDKLTGALYLGDLMRRIVDQLVTDGVLFGGQGSDQLSAPNSFPAKYVAEILMDEDSAHYKNTRRIMDELHIANHCTGDYSILRQVAEVITDRSAAIVATAISALLRCIGKSGEKVLIGVGGTLYRYHPTFRHSLEKNLRELVPTDYPWEVVDVIDGSGRGAAMVAAVAEKLES